MSGGARFHSLAPGQHSFEESSQRWQTFDNIVSDLTGPEIERLTSTTDSDVLDGRLHRIAFVNIKPQYHEQAVTVKPNLKRFRLILIFYMQIF